jgi:hypothetical protein
MLKRIYSIQVIMAFALVTGCDSNQWNVIRWMYLMWKLFYTNETEIQGGVNACYTFVVSPQNISLPRVQLGCYCLMWFLSEVADLRKTSDVSFDFKEGYFRSLLVQACTRALAVAI